MKQFNNQSDHLQQLSVLELATLLNQEAGRPTDLQLLDVREDWETEIASIEGSLFIPMGELPERFAELQKTAPVVCICHHGVRSMQVAYFLEHQGFTQVANLAGGIDAWAREVDITCASY